MVFRIVALVLMVAACASGGEEGVTPTPDADTETRSDAQMSPGDGGTVGPAMCPAGQLATDVSGTGEITCATFETATRDAIADSCSVYLGWRDKCDGCTTPPLKWGYAGAGCTNIGPNTRCITASLGGAQVTLFALDIDGDMDGNDKLYSSLHCTQPPATASAAPCPPGSYVSGRSGGSYTCTSLASAAIAYVRNHCSLYVGWQDKCDACTRAPSKWGHAGSTTCQNGAGIDNTCTTATLGSESVRLFGLNPDGDVDNNDKFHVGLRCTPPAQSTMTAQTECPAGHFVVGTTTDGAIQCESAASAFHAYFSQQCTLYFGWRDKCDGCTLPPSKWGQVKVDTCTLGVGLNNTCGTFSLGGTSVTMFGLDTDGDVDGNDMFYVGLRCN